MAIEKNKSTDANQQYWAYVEETSRDVEKWPAWLRCEGQTSAPPEKGKDHPKPENDKPEE